MASQGRSRWAVDDDDDEEAAETVALRKKEKEEKKRLKLERARQQQEAAKAAEAASKHTHGNGASVIGDDDDDSLPPTKRRKTSDPPSASAIQEGAHILQFPSRSFGPSRDVNLYELLNNIEEGSYGFVSRARYKATGEVVALKRLKLDHTNEGFPVTGLREIQTLKACHHPHIVHLREIVVDKSLQDVYLVLDFIEHDLKTLLEDNPEPFLPSETKTLMLQIVSATEYLHDHYILHRDLKTSNLLLNNRGEIKLADFGMARYTSDPPPSNLTQLVVTLWYRAPELLLGASTYAFEIDVWSLGCIFAELLTSEPLFQGRNEVDQLANIFALVGTPTRESWPEFHSLPNAKALHPLLSASSRYHGSRRIGASKFPYLTSSGLKLLSAMLSLNPADRPSTTKILSHRYFREDPRPKPKEMFPTFPSRAGQEKRRRKVTPNAPGRGEAPELKAEDFAGIFDEGGLKEKGGGFALRLG